MAVENDYNLLVHNLNELEKTISWLRAEVQRRREREAFEHLEPNHTDWLNLIGFQLGTIQHTFDGLRVAVVRVMESEPGEAVYPDQQPPTAADTL